MRQKLIDPLHKIKANKETTTIKVEANLMDEYGVCPFCKKKMEEATCARKEVFLCADDRVILPRTQEEK